ncbi:DNA topoisomerase 2-binding protein 1 [Condylostylus longicornis]|uniref:DNA topoisomerase 2-binding protein 1 n=1 Tax=Condylostylus longicornis TaxID=2530218 RepID=UPI00244E33AE|nr:DNA topoisomerase 2-binding protein 1 [Condylostylus longicornis]
MESFQDTGVHVYFVYKKKPLEANITEVMNSAFTYLQNYIDNKQITWILEKDVVEFVEKEVLTKKHIFVLQAFEGEVFEKLQTTAALVIGPRCLLSCILDDLSVPLGTSPIFATSMRDMSICISGLKDSEKQNLRTLISYMGGHYIKDLRRTDNLYLVSNTIKSTKYEQATLNSIPVMLPEWVTAVWEKSKNESISATDAHFDKYKLPIFYAVNITTTGLSGEIRDKIMKLVTDNGGIFQRTFKSTQTDILLTVRECAHSEKFKAAVKCKKDVLKPDWVFDSVAKGYALPIVNYRVKSLKISTPTKIDNSIPDFVGNFTQLSDISRVESLGNQHIENEMSICSNASVESVLLNDRSTRANHEAKKTAAADKKLYKKILCSINTQQAKRAGNFLDGCSIFLCGFTDEEKDKLNKILGVSGANYYSEMNHKITHVIVGDLGESDFNELNAMTTEASIVTLDWIVDSIKAKQPILNDSLYRPKLPIQRELEAPSPRSKKSLQVLNHSFKKPELPRKKLFAATATSKDQYSIIDEAEVNGLLCHYSPDNASLPHIPKDKVPPKNNVCISNISGSSNKSETVYNNENLEIKLDCGKTKNVPELNSCFESNTQDLSNVNFFDGLAIYVDKNYDQELYSQIVCDCEQALGKLVSDSYRDQVDYVIVSYEMAVDISKIPVSAKNIVNGLWMDDAITANELVPIEYFHKPIPLSANKKPLKGMVIVVSSYGGSQRCFLEQLSIVLGATYKDTYMKKDKALLVVPYPEGMKYKAAIKWGYPAVVSDWLIKCAETGTKVEMDPYLVGESKVNDRHSLHNENSINSLGEETPTSTKFKKIKLSTPDRCPQKNINDDIYVTPLRHRRVSELAGGPQHQQSPTDEKNLADENLMPKISSPVSPFVDVFDDLDAYLSNISNEDVRDCCKQILLKAKNTETPELERLKKFVKTPGGIDSPGSPVTIPDFCKTPEFRKRMFDLLEKRWHLSVEKRKPDTPLSEIKRRLWRETLPADFLAHLESFRNDSEMSAQKDQLSTENTSAEEKSMTKNKEINVTKPVLDSDLLEKKHNNINEASPGVKRLKDFIKTCEEEKNNSARKSNSIKNPPITRVITDEETQNVGLPQRYESEIMFNSERMVGWGDNMNFVINKRNHSDGMEFKGVPLFNISTTADFDKTPIIDGIKKLRGEVCENITIHDPKCTHIVCERPNRGEKLLSSVASGKWILSVNYVIDSVKQGYFLSEELYEWGNPKAINLPVLKSAEQAIANAFHSWRCRIFSDSSIKGAFTGFRVILHLPEKSQNSFANVIKSGDGTVLQCSPPYEEAIIRQATHCFVDPKKTPLMKEDKQKLLATNIPVVSFMYISSYLTNDPNVDITEFVLSL